MNPARAFLLLIAENGTSPCRGTQTILGYDASKDREKAFFTGKLGNVFLRSRVNKIRFGNATQVSAYPARRQARKIIELGGGVGAGGLSSAQIC